MKIAIIGDALDYQYAGIYYYTKELINALAQIDKKNEYWIVREKSAGDISENVKELIIPSKKIPGGGAYRLSSILKRADHIITNSNFTAQDVINYFPLTKNKTSGILLGKEDFFKPTPNLPILAKLGLQAPYILHTGTIEPRKNLPLLVKAFEQIKKEKPTNLQLVLVGKLGWKSASLQQQIAASPFKKDIKLLGYVERAVLPTIYTGATAFVYPSHFEGFGLPVLEAMSCGTPVVVSNTSSLPEIIGTAGLAFSPNNLDQLIKSIHQILEDRILQQTLSKQSLLQATKFSWHKTAQETLKIFEQLMQ